jgi:hypothetical protein
LKARLTKTGHCSIVQSLRQHLCKQLNVTRCMLTCVLNLCVDSSTAPALIHSEYAKLPNNAPAVYDKMIARAPLSDSASAAMSALGAAVMARDSAYDVLHARKPTDNYDLMHARAPSVPSIVYDRVSQASGGVRSEYAELGETPNDKAE